MKTNLKHLCEVGLKQIQQELKDVNSLSQIHDIQAKYLNKTGYIFTSFLHLIPTSPKDQIKVIGEIANQFRNDAQALINIKKEIVEHSDRLIKYENDKVDLTLKARYEWGSIHPVAQILERSLQFFNSLNFKVIQGSEIESDKYNFHLLNISDKHPAKTETDTFYINNQKYLLRTHCTSATARILEKNNDSNPLRVMSYGPVFRKDEDDATHSHQFTQVDVVLLDKHVSLANLKWLLVEYLTYIFEKETEIRFRNSYFPFTEPSLEVDIKCIHCDGKGCSICKHSGWVEILGAGLINPQVLKLTNNNPDKLQGLAFGIGLERVAMLKFKINDIRHFYNNDIDFLRQFGNLG